MINLKVIFMFLALYSFASAQWVDVSIEKDLPTFYDIEDFYYDYFSYYLIAASDGKLYQGSPTYFNIFLQEIETGTDADLFTCFAFDAKHVWIGGDNFLARSTDSAQTFTEIALNQPLQVRELQFTSPVTGYFFTKDGKFAHTTDGGLNWEINTITSDSLSSFQVMENDSLILVGDKGQIYLSPPYPLEWKKIETEITTNITDIDIYRNGKGYLSTKKAFKTTDFGKSWEEETLVPESESGYIAVAVNLGQNVAAFFEANHRCLRLSGSHTQYEEIPVLGEITTADYYWSNGAFFVLGTNMMIALAQGALSFHQLAHEQQGYLNDIQFLNSDTGFVYGSQTYYTENGGETWNDLPDYESSFGASQGHFYNLDEGLLSYSSSIYKTTDRGENWDYVLNADYALIYSGYEKTTFIASDTAVYRSTDFGNTWTSLPYQDFTGYSFYPQEMFFVNDSIGYIFGIDEMVKSTDGGNSWHYQNSILNYPYAHSVIKENHAIAICMIYNGYDVEVSYGMLTSDGGENWEQTFTYDDVYCHDVEIDTTGFGLMSRSDKKLLITNDGGNSWNEKEYPFYGEINELEPDKNGGMYAVDFFNKRIYHNKNLGFITVGIEEIQNKEIHPHNFTIYQNYPNPFNPETTIRFYIPLKSSVVVTVYNMLGELVAQPINNVLEAGEHSIKFSADNLPSGIYFYRIQAGKNTETRKMILLK